MILMLPFSTEYHYMDIFNPPFPDVLLHIWETTSFWFIGWLLNIGDLVYILLGVTVISLSRAWKGMSNKAHIGALQLWHRMVSS